MASQQKQGNQQPRIRFEAHPVVFPAAAGLVVLFVLLTAMWPNAALMWFKWLHQEITANFAWLYIISMSGFLVFALYLCFSRFGKIKLGRDEDEPEFPTLTWFAMLFSAGMGIGMLFYGVTEPINHYNHPPRADGGTLEGAMQAMATSLAHWCLHPWALYALVALALAYFGFRRGLPLSFRSVFYPMFGKAIHGRLGDGIDIIAVLATLFGLATSLGLGAKQVNAGLNFVFGMPVGWEWQVILIAVITGAAVISLVTGLDVGIRRLSEFNMGLAGFLLLFLFVMGPTVYLLGSAVENTGNYLQWLPTTSFWTATYEGGDQAGWFGGWTVFYWAWWIAWSPFVGMFIARVSKGRTIREFITGVLLVPSAVAILWMTGFGNTALHQEIYKQVATNPAAVERAYNYDARTYEIQETDEQTGLPMAAGSNWLIAPDAKGIESPIRVRVRPTQQQVGPDTHAHFNAQTPVYETQAGDQVAYNKWGVLVSQQDAELYTPPASSVFNGSYAYEETELTLAGYISNPVLTESRQATVDANATAMFVMLQAYALPWLTSIIATLSVILFFITSSDSASLVADIIATGGNENPPTATRIFWGTLEGCLAAVLLLAGGLQALQTGSITLGLPFCVVIILMCFSLHHGLKRELEGQIPDAQQQYIEGRRDSLPDPEAEEELAKV